MRVKDYLGSRTAWIVIPLSGAIVRESAMALSIAMAVRILSYKEVAPCRS